MNGNLGTCFRLNLLSVQNREVGLNNSARSPAKKTREFRYSYHGFNRLTQLSVGSTVQRTYVYDSNTDAPSYSQYPAGRLVEVKYPAVQYSPSGACSSPNASTMFTDMFSYTQAGQVAGKDLRVAMTQPQKLGGTGQCYVQTAVGDMNLVYAYNNEGRVTQVTYPTDSNLNTPTFSYSYDSMMRLSSMNDTSNYSQPVVNGLQYNAANQVKAINYYDATETRSYNGLQQLSNITASDPYLPSSNIKVSYNYTDVAKNKTATQSSTLSGFSTAVASSAVDGNTDGNFFDGSVSHTNDDPNAWWEVDLGYSTTVSSIVIWNRTDCCGSRLSDYWVFVSDTPFLSTDTPATLQNRPGTWSSHQTTQPNPSVSVSIPQAQGRYVRVQLSGTNYLALAEVQVYGTNSGPGANTSKINSVYDAISGESVAYQYDSLNRLISAAGSGWTQTQAYDGFGNLTGRTGTGTAQSTTISTPVNATTNQLSGYTYDTNSNLISTGYTYDVENRISFANAGGVQYFYDAQNKRVWQATCLPGSCTPGGTWILNSATVNLFGADRKQLASYGPIPAWNNMTTNQVAITFGPVAVRSYFGGKLVGQQLGTNIYEPVIQDRLGSVGKYYPYGEERNSPQLPNDQVKFATYTRDSATGNDYADQRYYTSVLGRMMTPDPYMATAKGATNPTDPQSWNRYAYVGADPVNRNDPTGQDWCDDEDLFCLATDSGGGPFGNLSAYFSSLAAQIAAEILAEKAALADTLSQADCTIEVFSRPTPSGGPGKGKGNHTYIYIFGTLLPPSGEMIEGGPIDGKLTGQINPPGQGLAAGKWNASDPDNSTNHEIGSALDDPGCVMSLELLNAVNNYNSGPKVAYTFLSGFSYNSNAFTYTLLEDIGEATYFGHPSGFTPGWDQTVPGLTIP